MTSARGRTERAGRIAVLVVDDDPEIADLVAAFLRRTDRALTVATETDPEAAIEAVGAGEYDWVVSDYHMPSMSGLALLERVAEVAPDVGRILHTSDDDRSVRDAAGDADVIYVRKRMKREQYRRLVGEICAGREVEAAD